MPSDSSYAVPVHVHPRGRTRRWIAVLITFLTLVLMSYWIPLYIHAPSGAASLSPHGPTSSLAEIIFALTAVLSEQTDDPRAWSFLVSDLPILVGLVALFLSSTSTILVALVTLRVPRRSMRIILLGMTTLNAILSGWVVMNLDRLFPSASGVLAVTVPGAYVAFIASLGAWGTTLVGNRPRKYGPA